MRQIDVSSAAPALPAPSAAGTIGFFTDGDPVAGTPATVVPGEWLNMVMMELVNVVLAGGIVPSKADFTQVLQAIQKIAGGSVNLAETGHVQFASGLTINWGRGSHANNSGAQQVAFDLAFGTGVLCSLASNESGGAPTAFHGTGLHTKGGMTVFSAVSSGVAAASGTAFHWIAVGF